MYGKRVSLAGAGLLNNMDDMTGVSKESRDTESVRRSRGQAKKGQVMSGVTSRQRTKLLPRWP